ncbi:hypothetical protein HMPREF3224_02228 [Anaerococcus hydrogenalis]|nr:hypothetical protein HMPREF3224_02228 [Anaerococcus hydrogenalis]
MWINHIFYTYPHAFHKFYFDDENTFISFYSAVFHKKRAARALFLMLKRRYYLRFSAARAATVQ